MTITVGSFRRNFVEFRDETTYLTDTLQFWLTVAQQMVQSPPWPLTMIDLGVQLFVAHNAVLEARANKEATAGALPGETVGPIASKSVGPASVSYDTGSGIEADAGHWNLTVYGTRFIHLVRIVGAAPLQVNGGGFAFPILFPGTLPRGM